MQRVREKARGRRGSKREEKSDGKRIYGEFMSCRVAAMCY